MYLPFLLSTSLWCYEIFCTEWIFLPSHSIFNEYFVLWTIFLINSGHTLQRCYIEGDFTKPQDLIKSFLVDGLTSFLITLYIGSMYYEKLCNKTRSFEKLEFSPGFTILAILSTFWVRGSAHGRDLVDIPNYHFHAQSSIFSSVQSWNWTPLEQL